MATSEHQEIPGNTIVPGSQGYRVLRDGYRDCISPCHIGTVDSRGLRNRASRDTGNPETQGALAIQGALRNRGQNTLYRNIRGTPNYTNNFKIENFLRPNGPVYITESRGHGKKV